MPRTIEHPGGTITILRDGDDAGEGLVRTATFPVPRWLLSGGMARSLEVVTEARRNEYARYEAVGKPLWSQGRGLAHPRADRRRRTAPGSRSSRRTTPTTRCCGRLFEQRVHRSSRATTRRIYETILGYLGPVTRVR